MRGPGNAGTMASLTGCWSWLIEQHRVPIHWLAEGVAGRTGDFLVASLERKRSFLVVKQGGLPLVAVMAPCAVVGAGAELVSMGVLMALAAGSGSSNELNVPHGEFHVRRLMAVSAGDGAMRTDQGKIGLRVVELCEVAPFPG